MKKFFNKQVAFVVLVSVFVGSLATAGVYAAIPNSNTGVISACRDNTTGALRAIDTQSGATCGGSESALKWSSQVRGNLMIDSLHDAKLTGARLQYLDLRGVNFTNSDFSDVRLSGSNLRNANFSGASLTGGTYLNEVDARNANFAGATLQMFAENAIMREANFSHVYIYSIEGGDYTDSDFTYAELGTINTANMTNVDFRHSTNNQSFVLTNVDMTSTNFSGITFGNFNNSIEFSNLTNSDFSNTIFAPLEHFIFSNNNASSIDFTNASFTGVVFINTDLSTANLTNTTWVNVVCPDGTNSDNNGATCLGHLTP